MQPLLEEGQLRRWQPRREVVFAFLLIVFDLQLIAVPLWGRYAEPKGYALAALSLLLGLAWARLASGAPEFPLPKLSLTGFLLPALAIFLLNARALTIDLPWRGDETFHMYQAKSLTLIAKPVRLIANLGITGIFLAWVWRFRPRIGIMLPAAAGMVTIQVMLLRGIYSSFFSLELYPYLGRWLYSLPVFLLELLRIPTPEIAFRMIPFLAVAALAAFLASRLGPMPAPLRLIYALMVATVPLVFYYTSVLYLEMPVVLLMAISLFRMRDLLTKDPAELPAIPAWYAVILIGFFKETALPFLLAFLLSRSIVRALPVWRSGNRLKLLARELGVGLCVLLPMALFLMYRRFGGYPRPIGFNPSYLLRTPLLVGLAKSYVEQFGLLLAAASAGIVLLARRREYAMLLFTLMAVAGHCCMHLLDDWHYVGYSRFNLFALPMILYWSYRFFQSLLDGASPSRRTGVGAILAIVIAANFLMSPVRLDGAKQPDWGQYFDDTSEHYYPYRMAARWLDRNAPGERVLCGGMYFYYWLEFYFPEKDRAVLMLTRNKHDSDAFSLRRTLARGRAEDFRWVLFHVKGTEPPDLEETYGYRRVETFRNSAHLLVLYAR